MDSMEIIFWILFLLAPFVARILKKRKGARRLPEQPQPQPRPQSQPQPQPRPQSQPQPQLQSLPSRDVERLIPGDDPAPERQLTPFREALRQIQDAMAEARETADQKAAPAAVVQPTPTASRQAERPVEPPRSTGSLREADVWAQATPRQWKPDVFKQSSYDDAFEAKAPYEESFHETVHSHLGRSAKEPERRKSKPVRSKWQEAYVLSEILSAPRSRTPWRSRMPR